MTSMPTLAQLASVFSCVKQLERYTMFVISRDEGLAISVSGGLYDVFNKNSRLKRKFIFSIPFVKVLEYDTLREESIPSAPTLVASNNDYEDGGGQEDFREEGKFGGGNEAKTAQFIEIASSFWNRMPEYWRSVKKQPPCDSFIEIHILNEFFYNNNNREVIQWWTR